MREFWQHEWVLDGRTPRHPVSEAEWLDSFRTNDARRVAQERVGKAWVSTVFLATDHGYGGTPILFETMIFNGDYDGRQWRYATWDEAEAGHRRIVEALQAGRDPDAE